MMTLIHNPILKGFNPNPSILRVGEDYYIATSTFEWFPGVQIHHSRDLVHWRLLTRPLDRVSQLDMAGHHASAGIWAPNLTWDDGTFYLVYTDVRTFSGIVKDTHNYVVTAPDIEGPWSEPTYLHSHGFDPSLYHENGRHWVLCMETDYRKGRSRFGGILLQEYDPNEHRLIGPLAKIFRGTELDFTEGPNLYKKNGWYYLIVAEGGTGLGHAVTVARARSITGPYEADPAGPVLTSRDHPLDPLQKAGHASIVEVPGKGSESGWYMAHLCGRPIPRRGRCTLGRETALQQVTWTEDGWLRVGPVAGRAALEVAAPDLPAHPWPEASIREDFDSTQLPLDFQTMRVPLGPDSLSLEERPGFLRLKGRESIGSRHIQALIARRQQAFRYRAATCLEFDPGHFKHSAGLICLYDQENLYYLKIGFEDGLGRIVEIVTRNNGALDFPLAKPVAISAEGRWVLAVSVDYDRLQFSHGPEGGVLTPIGDIFDASTLSDEYSHEGKFTGAFVGLCCQDLTGGRQHADFDWFEYEELPEEISVGAPISKPPKVF
jgi:xylan 1,4-beta-xylosidase